MVVVYAVNTTQSAKTKADPRYQCPTCGARRRYWRQSGYTASHIEYCDYVCWQQRREAKDYNERTASTDSRWLNVCVNANPYAKKRGQQQVVFGPRCPECGEKDSHAVGTNRSKQWEYRRWACGKCGHDFSERRAKGKHGRWKLVGHILEQLRLQEDSAVAQMEFDAA